MDFEINILAKGALELASEFIEDAAKSKTPEVLANNISLAIVWLNEAEQRSKLPQSHDSEANLEEHSAGGN